jgi:hypothetical protein
MEMSLGIKHEKSLDIQSATRVRRSLNLARDMTYLTTNANFHYYQHPAAYNESTNEEDEINVDDKPPAITTDSINDFYNQKHNNFSSTSRSFTHPDYHSVHSQYIEKNREKLESIQKHRQQRRNKLLNLKQKRNDLESSLRLQYPRYKNMMEKLNVEKENTKILSRRGSTVSYEEQQQAMIDIGRVERAVKLKVAAK